MNSRGIRLSLVLLGGLAMGITACQEVTESGQVVENELEPMVGKGDCPDCDDAGPGAMIQAGLADRFYAAGDTWLVAYQFNRRHDMAREVVLQVAEEDLPLGAGVQSARDRSPLFLFEYGVKQVHEQVFDTKSGQQVEREVATIEIVPGDTGKIALPELLVTEEFTQVETKLQFELNDLLDPVSETIFTRSFPNGKRIDATHKSRLRTGSSIFPHTIPRALVSPGYVSGESIDLSPELEAIADATIPGWRTRVYYAFRFNGIGEEDGQRDRVFWAEGDLWPFYVQSDQGAGVLLRFNDAVSAGQ